MTDELGWLGRKSEQIRQVLSKPDNMVLFISLYSLSENGILQKRSRENDAYLAIWPTRINFVHATYLDSRMLDGEVDGEVARPLVSI